MHRLKRFIQPLDTGLHRLVAVSAAHWRWRRATDWSDLEELMELVEPNIFDKTKVATRYPNRLRAYVGTIAHSLLGGALHSLGVSALVAEAMGADAVALAAWLPESKVVHVEDFAIHPRWRGEGLARPAWTSWRAFLAQEWPETRVARDAMTIEVYLQNIEAWRKIMGVHELVTDMQPLYLLPTTPIQLMGRDLTCPVRDVYAEFQAFQRKWHRDVVFERCSCMHMRSRM